MEIGQYGDTVCIHFFIKIFQVEGVIKRVKRKKKYVENIVENMSECQEGWKEFERNKNAMQEVLRMRERF